MEKRRKIKLEKKGGGFGHVKANLDPLYTLKKSIYRNYILSTESKALKKSPFTSHSLTHSLKDDTPADTIDLPDRRPPVDPQ